jgi:hypothetical protein
MNEPQTTLTAEEFGLLLRKLLEEELKKPPIEEPRTRKPNHGVSDTSRKRREAETLVRSVANQQPVG